MQTIRRETNSDGLCVLTFDRHHSSANIFDRATLEELDRQLDVIVSIDTRVRALILTSAKDTIFVAGADLHGIRSMSLEEVEGFIALGQSVFTKLAHLKIPTVAAIHGAAVGGGCEVTLACDWRVASPDHSTKIGLPETSLGIIPAWGGCTRLPKLVGVPKALDLILGAKTLSAKRALKMGLIDEIAPRERLIAAAEQLIKRGKRHQSFAHSAPVNAVVDAVIARQVRHGVEEKTHGHYPAVQKAMQVVMADAAAWSERASLAREREAIRELLPMESTRNLLQLFFEHERAKKRRVLEPTGEERKVTRTAVIGAGVMGAGIAQWVSARGLRVILRDVDTSRVAAGMATITSLYASGVKRRSLTEHDAHLGLDRISPAPQEVPLTSTHLVIEAAVEEMNVKQDIFRRLEELSGEETILATNTSALSITELASATARPDRVVGIHFFNPVHRMQLVEVIAGKETSPETVQRSLRFVQQIGKLPVLVQDSPGFVVNRILLPYLSEAAWLFDLGTEAHDIDQAMLDFGMPMGPLRLIDEVGIDIASHVAHTLTEAYPKRMRVPVILRMMLNNGYLGRKNGQGFYYYPAKGEPEPNPTAAALCTKGEPMPLAREEIARCLVLPMLNEAARCVEEGVVETAGDVDFAMVTGTGWAPFRGGPLRYVDSLGAAWVVDELARLSEGAGLNSQPCALLQEMARTNRRFYED